MAAYEIVRVLDGKCLIDAESYQRTYTTRGGRVLTPGYYVAMWSSDSVMSEFNDRAEYFGPFGLALHAKLKLPQILEEFEARRPPLCGAHRAGGGLDTSQIGSDSGSEQILRCV